jgi:hypothetical protein
MASGPGLAPEWSLYAQQLLDIYNEFPEFPRSQVDVTLARNNEFFAQQLSVQPRLPRVPTWRTAWPGALVWMVDFEFKLERADARVQRLRAARCRLLWAKTAGAAARALPADVVWLVARHLPVPVRRSYRGGVGMTEYPWPSRGSESRKRRRR